LVLGPTLPQAQSSKWTQQGFNPFKASPPSTAPPPLAPLPHPRAPPSTAPLSVYRSRRSTATWTTTGSSSCWSVTLACSGGFLRCDGGFGCVLSQTQIPVSLHSDSVTRRFCVPCGVTLLTQSNPPSTFRFDRVRLLRRARSILCWHRSSPRT
jgi:hypothetical protein